MKKLIITLLLISTNIWAEELKKIAIVDLQSVLDNSTVIKSVKKQVDDISLKLHNEISKKEADLKKSEATLLNKRSLLTEQQFEKEAMAFNKLVSDIQKETQEKKRKLDYAQSSAMTKVIDEYLVDVVNKIAKAKNLQIVIPHVNLLYYDHSLDITTEVIYQLNQLVTHIDVKLE